MGYAQTQPHHMRSDSVVSHPKSRDGVLCSNEATGDFPSTTGVHTSMPPPLHAVVCCGAASTRIPQWCLLLVRTAKHRRLAVKRR